MIIFLVFAIAKGSYTNECCKCPTSAIQSPAPCPQHTPPVFCPPHTSQLPCPPIYCPPPPVCPPPLPPPPPVLPVCPPPILCPQALHYPPVSPFKPIPCAQSNSFIGRSGDNYPVGGILPPPRTIQNTYQTTEKEKESKDNDESEPIEIMKAVFPKTQWKIPQETEKLASINDDHYTVPPYSDSVQLLSSKKKPVRYYASKLLKENASFGPIISYIQDSEEHQKKNYFSISQVNLYLMNCDKV